MSSVPIILLLHLARAEGRITYLASTSLIWVQRNALNRHMCKCRHLVPKEVDHNIVYTVFIDADYILFFTVCHRKLNPFRDVSHSRIWRVQTNWIENFTRLKVTTNQLLDESAHVDCSGLTFDKQSARHYFKQLFDTLLALEC